jgi:hypothetical protein
MGQLNLTKQPMFSAFLEAVKRSDAAPRQVT